MCAPRRIHNPEVEGYVVEYAGEREAACQWQSQVKFTVLTVTSAIEWSLCLLFHRVWEEHMS